MWERDTVTVAAVMSYHVARWAGLRCDQLITISPLIVTLQTLAITL